MGRPSLSIIIPCYNEASVIETNLEEVREYLDQHGWDYELLVIDDGSGDRTREVAKAYADQHSRITVLSHMINKGRGAALRTGFSAAKNDLIITLDADLSYSPQHIEHLLESIKKEQADIVQVSPYAKGGTARNVPRNRLLISRWSNRLLTALIYREFTVVTCIVRAYRREVIQEIHLQSDGKEIHLEILSKARDLGLRIIEIPGDLYWRPHKVESGSHKRKPSFRFFRMALQHIIFSMNEAPLVFLGLLGAGFILLAVGLGSIFIYQWLYASFNPQRPLVTVMMLSFLAGVMTMIFAFLAGQNRYLKKELTVTQSLLLRKQ